MTSSASLPRTAVAGSFFSLLSPPGSFFPSPLSQHAARVSAVAQVLALRPTPLRFPRQPRRPHARALRALPPRPPFSRLFPQSLSGLLGDVRNCRLDAALAAALPLSPSFGETPGLALHLSSYGGFIRNFGRRPTRYFDRFFLCNALRGVSRSGRTYPRVRNRGNRTAVATRRWGRRRFGM